MICLLRVLLGSKPWVHAACVVEIIGLRGLVGLDHCWQGPVECGELQGAV